MSKANPKEPGPLTFAILYLPGPKWVAGRTLAAQDLQTHRDYLAVYADEGRVESAGPFTDNSGGMVILRAESQAEADRFIAADPGVLNGVFVAHAREWHVAFRKKSRLPTAT